MPRLRPRFFTQKIAANIKRTKFEDIKPNDRKSKKGVSVKAEVEFVHAVSAGGSVKFLPAV